MKTRPFLRTASPYSVHASMIYVPLGREQYLPENDRGMTTMGPGLILPKKMIGQRLISRKKMIGQRLISQKKKIGQGLFSRKNLIGQ